MLAAHSVVNWTCEQQVVNCLDGLAALASNLGWGVIQEESLCVTSYKCMSGDYPIHCAEGSLGELS